MDWTLRVRGVPTWLPGLVPWVVALVVVAVWVVQHPGERTLGPLYAEASSAWWSGASLYRGHWGMNYLPHFPILYAPFAVLGGAAGEIAWRAVAVTWLALATWQLFRAFDREMAGVWFFWGSLLALPICLAALRNGQANLLLAATLVQAAACVATRRWWPAAFVLVLAVAIKPVGIVMLLLAAAGYRPLWPRLAVAVAVFAALPFLLGSPAYAVSQHAEFAANLRDCAAAAEHRFDNVNGILRTLGIEPADAAGDPVDGRRVVPHLSTTLSLLGAVATLAAWCIAGRRVTRPQREVLLLVLATTYLMLFNPMNESNGYVIVAPAMAIVTVGLLLEDGTRRRGLLMVGIMLSLGIAAPIVYPHAPRFSTWWFPATTIVFAALALAAAWRGGPRFAQGSSPSTSGMSTS